MAEVKLEVTKREGTGKGAARRSRFAGKVPGVVYGRGMDPVAVEVDRRQFVQALQTDAGMNVLLGLKIDGQSITTLAREIQRDPVRGTLLHADFVKVDLNVEVEAEVPVHLIGGEDSPGVRGGGVLEQPLFTVTVRALPADLPESIDADASGLDAGHALRISDLSSARTFEFVQDPETVVASIAQAVSEEELAALEAAAGASGEDQTVEGLEAATGATGDESDGSGEPSVEADPGAEKEPA
ncbi:MAG: 50S ribosomal protein L25 [Actinomycetota bacterium]|nr:50S ribosomal protein L25 [Actinomycetota bacterium]